MKINTTKIVGYSCMGVCIFALLISILDKVNYNDITNSQLMICILLIGLYIGNDLIMKDKEKEKVNK